jgi:hypothetical protein
MFRLTVITGALCLALLTSAAPFAQVPPDPNKTTTQPGLPVINEAPSSSPSAGASVPDSRTAWIHGLGIAVAVVMIFAGTILIRDASTQPDNALRDYVIPLTGIVFVSPLIVVMAIITNLISSDALIGLLSTIVGYFFGSWSKK